jgi:hypothetical protein
MKKVKKTFANAAPEIVLAGWAVVAFVAFVIGYAR